MDLGNPSETIVHYLLIEEMAYLGPKDGFLMVIVLVHLMHTGLNL